MSNVMNLDEARFRLQAAMELVRQDRWVLGGLRDGRLKVIADSRPDPKRKGIRHMELTPLARRCLYERRALSVSSITEVEAGPEVPDWEMDWPAILYAPVGMPTARPVGLVIVGSRKPHWFEQEEIDYVSAVAVTLTSCVLTVTGPLGRLHPRERHAAQLLSEGLSVPEIGRALKLEPGQVESVVASVLQKLSLRSRRELGELMPDRPVSSGGFLV